MKTWNEGFSQIEHAYLSGTKAMHGTLDNSAVVDNGDGTVGIAITAHGLSALNQVVIAGTTNYNGVYTIQSVDTNVINITATYVAETPAGTETYKTCFKNVEWNDEFQIMEVRLTLSAAGGAAEAYSIKIDHAQGAAWDAILDSVADTTSTVSDIWKAWTERRYCNADDVVFFEYANTNSRTWGIEIIYRPRA